MHLCSPSHPQRSSLSQNLCSTFVCFETLCQIFTKILDIFFIFRLLFDGTGLYLHLIYMMGLVSQFRVLCLVLFYQLVCLSIYHSSERCFIVAVYRCKHLARQIKRRYSFQSGPCLQQISLIKYFSSVIMQFETKSKIMRYFVKK